MATRLPDLTEEDLGSFDLKKYDLLKDLNEGQFASLVKHRRYLWFRVAKKFEAIQRDPEAVGLWRALADVPLVRSHADIFEDLKAVPPPVRWSDLGPKREAPPERPMSPRPRSPRIRLLEVNLDSSNGQLMGAFARLLKQFREVNNEPTTGLSVRFPKTDVQRKWQTEGVIPYLDLRLCARLLNLRLPIDLVIEKLSLSTQADSGEGRIPTLDSHMQDVLGRARSEQSVVKKS